MANQKGANEPVFTKKQIVESYRFANNRDVIDALLEDGKSYSIKEVDSIVKSFLEKEVK